MKYKLVPFILLSIAIIVISLSLFLFLRKPNSLVELEKQNEELISNQLIEEVEASQPPSEQTSTAISALVKAEKLYITFDFGDNWQEVPVELSEIISGEYSPSYENGLMTDSYFLNDEQSSFLVFSGEQSGAVSLLQSVDQGESWQHYEIVSGISPLRYRKLEFLTKNFGYLTISAGRTMGQEGSAVYLTNDGGRTWQTTASLETTTLVQNSSFTDSQTGFVAYKSSAESPLKLAVTQNGGESWAMAEFSLPEKYQRIFLCTEAPFKERDDLAVLVNQGESGDYKGGLVKGKFLSKDNGLTWAFSEEVAGDD